MRIQKRKKSSKKITPIVLSTILVLCLVLALLFVYLRRNSPESTNDNANSSSGSSRESDDTQAKNIHDDPTIKQQTPNTDAPANPTNTAGTSKQQVQMTASTNTSNGVVFIRGGIDYPVSNGSCYALLSGPSGQSIKKETSLLQNPASTDCKTIAIRVSELSSGRWTFILHYTSNDYEGVSNEISFSL